MDYIEEFKKFVTVLSFTKEEAKNHENIFVRLMVKDINGKASREEKISILIDSLLSYNNIDYISKEEIFECAKKINSI
jgi:hypothetical protein